MIFYPKNKRIRVAVLLVILILVFGVGGYMLIEGYTFIDSLYMTIITVSTVGFREVHELSDNGKLFTSLLVVSSLGTFAYAVSTITSNFIEGELAYFFQRRRIKSDLKYMKNHIIVCGYGRNGNQTVAELIVNKHPYVIIENNKEIVSLPENSGLNFIEGDATSDEILEKAGIQKAKGLITTMPIDADNLFVVISARTLNPNLSIISRASSESTEKKLKRAGANNVIMPEKVGGSHMASLVLKPDIVEFLEHIHVQDNRTNLEEIQCSKLLGINSEMSIYDLGIRKKTGANIIGFKTPEGEYIINPLPDTKMIPNAKIFVLGTREQIEKMKEVFTEKNS